MRKVLLFAVALIACHSTFAANILYVANGSSSSDAPSAADTLEAAGHTVTRVQNDLAGGDNLALQGDLSAYGMVVWGASDNNKNDPPLTSAATIAALTTYVSNGGFLYITGYDSVASPDDQLLADFISNGTGVTIEDTDRLGPIASANVLTQGVQDLVGVTPSALDDQDSIVLSGFGSGVTGVSCDGTGCSWILRSLGSGYVTYVSTDDQTDGVYTDSDPADAYYAYHFALLNFASNAPAASAPAAPVPTLPLAALGLLGGLAGLLGMRQLRKAA